jgi:transposase
LVVDVGTRDRLIEELLAQVVRLQKRVERLERENAELKSKNARLTTENEELRARLNESSRNSSSPPSSDGPEVTRPGKPRGRVRRKRGGQPGHAGAKRERLPATRVVDYRPERCRRCAHGLSGNDAQAKWTQVVECPKVEPEVTEHRAHALTCEGCGEVTEAVLPTSVLDHGFGPRLSALVAYLTGRCHLPKRQVVEFCADVLGTPLSLGAVCGIEQDVSAALAAPVEEAWQAVQEQPVANLDETGWREDKKKAWLWTAVTAVVIVFRIARSRGGEIAREILGEGFKGFLGSDRWSAYNWVDVLRRQLCWAHLLRDFQGMVDRGGVGGRMAAGILKKTDKMFEWWAEVRDGTLSRRRFRKRMKAIRRSVEQALWRATTHAEKKTAGMCTEILKLAPALWTFVDHTGIEPTNNSGERAIRNPVTWRKVCFGTDSPAGSRFVERILTVTATVRLRGGNVLEYLAEACASHRLSHASPSLLAVGSTG